MMIFIVEINCESDWSLTERWLIVSQSSNKTSKIICVQRGLEGSDNGKPAFSPNKI